MARMVRSLGLSVDREVALKFAMILAVLGGLATGCEQALAVPRKAAADFTLVDLEGNGVSLASLKGKAVVLNFWAVG